MSRPAIQALAALLLAGCAAAPAPPLTAAAPAPPASAPRPPNAPEIPAAPSAPPPPPEGSPAASGAELEDIATRLGDVNRSATASPSRAPVAPEPFRIDELPSLTVPEPLDFAAAPTQSGGDAATELVVDWKSSTRPLGPVKSDTYTSVRVGMSGNVSGKLRIGHSESTVSAGAGGPFVSCGGVPSSLRKLVPARWEVVEPTPKGGLEYRVVNAWFDTQTCTASIVARASVSAQRLAGGMLYGFRQRGVGPAQDEVLTLIGPRFAHLATGAVGGDASVSVNEVSRITLPIRRGGGASVLGRVSASTARDWTKLTGLGPTEPGDLIVGVEISQGVEDPSPLALAYLGLRGASTPTAQAGQNPSNSVLLDPFLRK